MLAFLTPVLLVIAILVVIAGVVMNNFDKKAYAADIASLKSTIAGRLPASVASAVGLSASSSPLVAIHVAAPPPVVSQATPAQIAAVPPVALDPTAAPAMTQVQIGNLGYVSYLLSLSPAQLAAWQSAYVTAAHALALTGSDQSAIVWNPSTGSAATIGSAAQSNLIVLRNLGATGLITGSIPNQ